jgi:hypothetical protein
MVENDVEMTEEEMRVYEEEEKKNEEHERNKREKKGQGNDGPARRRQMAKRSEMWIHFGKCNYYREMKAHPTNNGTSACGCWCCYCQVLIMSCLNGFYIYASVMCQVSSFFLLHMDSNSMYASLKSQLSIVNVLTIINICCQILLFFASCTVLQKFLFWVILLSIILDLCLKMLMHLPHVLGYSPIRFIPKTEPNALVNRILGLLNFRY